MSRTAIYPGSFDPVTFGHIDVIKRATRIFDKIIVAVAEDANKKALFTLDERRDMMIDVTQGMENVSVETFNGLVIDFAHKRNINVLVRGLRMTSDFDYELQMALTNRRLAQDIETVFLMPSEGYSFLSSSLIKQSASLGADVSTFVPSVIEARLKDKLNS